MQYDFYSEKECSKWDQFLSDSFDGNFLHSRKFLSYHRDRFKDRSIIISSEKGDLLGILPLAEDLKDSEVLISHPGSTYGGIIHSGNLRGELMIEALNDIKSLLYRSGYKSMIYKPIPEIYKNPGISDDIYALWLLGASCERVDLTSCIKLENRLKISSQRVRSLKKSNKIYHSINKDFEKIDQFWEILTENLQKFNISPVHSLFEIKELASKFSTEISLITTEKNHSLTAGVLLFNFENVDHAQYIASSSEGHETSALDFIFDYCIKEATSNNKDYFNFGISTEENGRVLNQGLYSYKNGYGSGSALHYFYKLDLCD